MPRQSKRGRGFTLIEMIIAMSVILVLAAAAFGILRSGQKESSYVLERMAAQQNTRVAFRRMCNEIREGRRFYVRETNRHFDGNEYRYTDDNTGRHVQYGPARNYVFFENFEGDIIAYFLYAVPGDNGTVRDRQLRRINVTRGFEDASEEPRIIARNVAADNAAPSIFSIGKAYPGKQLSTVLLKLSLVQGDRKTGQTYTLVSSVFMRNLPPLVQYDLNALEDVELEFKTE